VRLAAAAEEAAEDAAVAGQSLQARHRNRITIHASHEKHAPAATLSTAEQGEAKSHILPSLLVP
jgi:hypothetical protein